MQNVPVMKWTFYTGTSRLWALFTPHRSTTALQTIKNPILIKYRTRIVVIMFGLRLCIEVNSNEVIELLSSAVLTLQLTISFHFLLYYSIQSQRLTSKF